MILEMKDICKDYPMGKSMLQVLKNVCLEVEEGEYLAIMGPSGSGKTTLMNLIGCLDVPTSGSYLLGGRDITKCSDTGLANLAVVVNPSCINGGTASAYLAVKYLCQLEQLVETFLRTNSIATGNNDGCTLEIVLGSLNMVVENLHYVCLWRYIF